MQDPQNHANPAADAELNETEAQHAAEAETVTADPTQRIAELEAALQAAEQKCQEQQDAWLRAKAEIENVRRRAQEDIAKASKFASEKFAAAMLPVKDSLEAALNIENQTLESLKEGVELTLKQLVSAFEGAGVSEENPLNSKFDPNKHQAMSAIPSDVEPNTVINVLQKGYLLHERVLRPALVMVSKAPDA